LMDFAETYARENQFMSVRLDTFSKNERNQRFYEARGYQKLEEIYFPNQSKDPFYCYEFVF
ncbi:MAG: GNAT family N-acetyltransferase, partial [Muriicola sp.]|nr:GNAT family N-acetyltransferase [Muriicola sp.]